MATATTTTTEVSTPANPITIDKNDPHYIPRGPVTATLNFFVSPSDGSKPYNYVEAPPPNTPQRNYSDNTHDVPISDIRNNENNFTIDTNAFAAVQQPPLSIPNLPESEIFASDDLVKKYYYPEVESLLKSHLADDKPKRVVFFDHTIRRAASGASRGPVTRTHIDQTSASAPDRVRFHLPDEADELLKGRVRIINVWRPLNGPVQSFPLAFADSTTVAAEDLIGIEHRYPDRTGEIAAVKYAEGQRWYYWSGIENGERLLLCCFDSETGGRVAHSAFVDPRSPVGGRGRESIEVRTLVFG